MVFTVACGVFNGNQVICKAGYPGLAVMWAGPTKNYSPQVLKYRPPGPELILLVCVSKLKHVFEIGRLNL